MTFGKTFSEQDLLTLVAVLDGQDHHGMPLSRLAREADLPSSTVDKLVSRHTEYFVAVGGKSVYTLNRFGPFSGSATEMAEDIRKKAKDLETSRDWFLWSLQNLFRGR